MLKRYLLICLMGALPAAASAAAEEAKPAASIVTATNAKSAEATLKAETGEAKNVALTRKRARWSRPGLDLTHCLSRETNAEIIRCAE